MENYNVKLGNNIAYLQEELWDVLGMDIYDYEMTKDDLLNLLSVQGMDLSIVYFYLMGQSMYILDCNAISINKFVNKYKELKESLVKVKK